MKTKTAARARIAIGVAALVVAAAFPFIFASCTPGDSITAAESDVVLTIYDTEFDFATLATYFMPDTVLHLTGDPDETDDPSLSRTYDSFVLGQIASHLASLGYVRVAAAANPDFIVQLGATSVDTYNVYSYWPGWYYPGYPGYWYPSYPYSSVSYAYTTGTVIVVFSSESVDPTTNVADVYWSGAINGVLNDTNASIQSRLQDTINQMFVQSPYLGAN